MALETVTMSKINTPPKPASTSKPEASTAETSAPPAAASAPPAAPSAPPAAEPDSLSSAVQRLVSQAAETLEPWRSPLRRAASSAALEAPAVADAVYKRLSKTVRETGLRREQHTLYTTAEDFERADPAVKRVVLLGCTGAGKSTIGNIIAGWKYVQCAGEDDEYAFEWRHPTEGAPLFESRADGHSVTSKTAFANVSWLGDAARPAIVVDTPGHDDTAAADLDSAASREKLGELAADLHDKLKALGEVHAIVVIHNDVMSNRLNPATHTVLEMVGEKFAAAGRPVWEHVVVAYSKCNAHETSWRAGLGAKKAAMQARLREIPGCDVDVPVLALGGGELEGGAGVGGGYDELWRFVEAAAGLPTKRLQPFEGADVKWQRLVDAKNDAEARAAAAMAHFAVVARVCCLLAVLFWRSYLLPAPLRLLCLNVPGAVDEVFLLTAFVNRLGPRHVAYSIQHFYASLIRPYVQPHLERAASAAEQCLPPAAAAFLKPKAKRD